MVIRGIAGPAKPTPFFRAAPPSPPWFLQLHLAPAVVPVMPWIAVLFGAAGLVAALIATRRGWRPSPRRLIAASVIAVLALMLIPPVAGGDPLYYAAYGRIALLGHNPYVAGSNKLLPPGDPIAAAIRQYVPLPASAYGPIATLTEEAAVAIGGDSPARILFWLKVWNALAYLVLVLVLDRVTRTDRTRRIRVHLLWSVNPLMLFLLMADGHNDVLGAALGATALFAMRKAKWQRAFCAGAMLVLAAAVKTSMVLFGGGIVWAARRSPPALVALAAGAAAVLLPLGLVGGRTVLAATTVGLEGREKTNLLWHDFARLVTTTHADALINVAGLLVSGALALVLLWRLPQGPPGLPGVREALALILAFLVASPYEQAWYDAMLFPLLAVMAVSRLDWVAVAHVAALTLYSVPYFYPAHRTLWSLFERYGTDVPFTLALAATAVALLWLCWTRDWRQSGPEDPLAGAAVVSPGAA